MAPFEHDSGTDVPEDRRPRASRNLPTTGRDKPLFTSRDRRERINFTTKPRDGDENRRPGSERGTWLSGKGMRLGEAFQRTDANGHFIPRPSAWDESARDLSDSRIPRTKSYSPSTAALRSSKALRDVQIIQERDRRAASVPANSDSDSTGALDVSPSPAARDRRWRKDETESDVSPITAGEDLTNDDFHRNVGRYSNDQERLRGLLSSQKGLFSRASTGPRTQETTRTLPRNTSASSPEDEPPIRPPRAWGSKANTNKDWLAKIMAPEPSPQIEGGLRDRPLSEAREAAADIPLPSVEDISPIQELTPPASRPASAQPKNSSPADSRMWNADLDFTAQSLQISSPQLRVKPTKLDEIRSREIQNMTARAVAAGRLEEIREKNSQERSITSETATVSKDPALKAVQREEPGERDEMTTMKEEGERIPGTPVTVFSNEAYDRYCKRTGRINRFAEGRPQQVQEDPLDVLRQLSRVLSKSPSPPRPEEKKDDSLKNSAQPSAEERKNVSLPQVSRPPTEEHGEEKSTGTKKGDTTNGEVEKQAEKAVEFSSKSNAVEIDAENKRNSGRSTPAKSDVDPEERIAAEARLFELQDNKSERNSIRAPSRSPSPSADGKLDETPRPRPDPLSLPTPKVTGAFIETPALSTRKPRKSRSIPPSYEVVDATNDATSSSDNKDTGESVSETSSAVDRPQRRRQLRRTTSHRVLTTSQQEGTKRRSRPVVINTAKTTSASEDLRRLQREAQLEDSTLERFDAILEAYARATEEAQNNTTILEPVLDLEYDERGLPLSARERARRIERLTLDRMTQSIKNTSSSIRDARHGIERLERQVSSSSVPTNNKVDDIVYIKVPVPRLWVSCPTKKRGILSRNWKFTWLGFILSLFFAWYISESIMCAQFCHITESSVPVPYQLDAPFFPWAIPTMLDQWTGNYAGAVYDKVRVALGGQPGPKWLRVKPGPMGASDWWVGRSGPIGIVRDRPDKGASSIFSDEMI